MMAKTMADYWVPYAQANKMVTVFPQVNNCWDNGQSVQDTSEPWFPNETYLSNQGFQNNFIMEIINQLKKPISKSEYEYIYEIEDDGITDINVEPV